MQPTQPSGEAPIWNVNGKESRENQVTTSVLNKKCESPEVKSNALQRSLTLRILHNAANPNSKANFAPKTQRNTKKLDATSVLNTQLVLPVKRGTALHKVDDTKDITECSRLKHQDKLLSQITEETMEKLWCQDTTSVLNNIKLVRPAKRKNAWHKAHDTKHITKCSRRKRQDKLPAWTTRETTENCERQDTSVLKRIKEGVYPSKTNEYSGWRTACGM